MRRSDVVTESFAPGVIERYGLGWETLREVKPDLVMISSCLLGQSGPWRDLTGFGNLAAAITGFQQLACWPGGPPAGPYAAYTDFIGVRYNALAILAALEYRDRTGLGQYIDMAQGEAALHFLAPAFLDYAAHGRVPPPSGNADRELHPHGIFPCAGEDAWVAIAVRDERDWRALCAAIGREDLLAAPRASASSSTPRSRRGRARTRPPRSRPRCRRAASPRTRCSTRRACSRARSSSTAATSSRSRTRSSAPPRSRARACASRARASGCPSARSASGATTARVLESILGYPPERMAELTARGVLR